MKFVSWNVNGLRACMNKGFHTFFDQMDADIFAIQETKMQDGQADLQKNGYYYYLNSAIRKGYSGTLIYTKEKPLNVTYGLGLDKHNDEGRVITLEYDHFYFVTVYSPNSKEGLQRLSYRMEFEDDLREYLVKLKQKKEVILCGDLNVAHEDIDLANPQQNQFHPGFSREERDKFSLLLSSGFTDTFRYLYPQKVIYSWWSYRFLAREKNIGWRIDYFIVSNQLQEHIKESDIMTHILGSDHAPVVLEINF